MNIRSVEHRDILLIFRRPILLGTLFCFSFFSSDSKDMIDDLLDCTEDWPIKTAFTCIAFLERRTINVDTNLRALSRGKRVDGHVFEKGVGGREKPIRVI